MYSSFLNDWCQVNYKSDGTGQWGVSHLLYGLSRLPLHLFYPLWISGHGSKEIGETIKLPLLLRHRSHIWLKSKSVTKGCTECKEKKMSKSRYKMRHGLVTWPDYKMLPLACDQTSACFFKEHWLLVQTLKHAIPCTPSVIRLKKCSVKLGWVYIILASRS